MDIDGPSSCPAFCSHYHQWVDGLESVTNTVSRNSFSASQDAKHAHCVLLPFALTIVCTPCRTGGGGDRERRGKATRKSKQPLNKTLLPYLLFPNGVPRAKDVLFHPITFESSLLSHVAIWHWKWQPPPLAAMRWRARSQFFLQGHLR